MKDLKMATNYRSSSLMEHTMLFPCAAGVQMPQLGGDKAKIKLISSKGLASKIMPMKIVSQDKNPVNDKYVKMVSTGLSFTEDVVQDRCIHMMPYDNKYFDKVFEPGELIPPAPRTHSEIGRHNKRGTDVRHMPCNLKKMVKPQPLTPLRKQAKAKALMLHKKSLMSSKEGKRLSLGESTSNRSQSSFFITQPIETRKLSSLQPILETEKKQDVSEVEHAGKTKLRPIQTEASGKKKEGKVGFSAGEGISKIGDDSARTQILKKETSDAGVKNGWDDYLMSRLSKLTANWLVHKRMPCDRNKEKLAKTLESWYGPPTHTELVREEMSDGEEEDEKKQKKRKSKWKKKEASLLQRVYNISPPPVEALDPYSDDSKAPFYRQPAGIRKKKKNMEKEEAGSINAIAHNISVRGYVFTPPLTLKDYLSPRVGEKIYESDNLFQQEWLTGKTQLHQVNGDPDKITMDSNNKYQKQIQREMPQQPKKWYHLDADGKEGQQNEDISMPQKGHKRWVGLPEPVDDTAGTMTTVHPGYDPIFMQSENPKQKWKVKQNNVLSTIVHDWRNKWFLSGQFADSTPEDLIRDMADIQPHVRLKAIGTVAKAAEYKPPLDSSIILDKSVTESVSQLPEQIFVALECLLDDSNQQVQTAAAITLYTLDRPTEKAKLRLRAMMEEENTVDRWAAAQCLAHYGECDSDVVAEIIKQILASESAVKHEQGIHLLTKISNSTTLVHCMIAEQLNSSSWRHRVIACKMLPALFGSINRDITQKLSELMWHDWHVEVRKAAAQCLGKTSHGRDVHDDIRDKILNGTERTKMEAINKLGQLGIMTAKLLPAFLQCFSDSYVSIRCEVCITCGNLKITEEQVLDRLVHLATFDPIWKVKALAIQALGKIGDANEDIKECLLWAMRYEERPGVRAEACHSLISLNIQDEDVIENIQDRLLVESSELVREEMIEALGRFGLSTSEDMDTVAQIKGEVRKLCTRNIIASQILVNENDETKREQLKRMVYQTEKDIEAMNERKAVILRNIRSQARSVDSLSSTPQPRTPTPLLKVKVDSESTTPELVSREGTVFTPTADKELEAILNQDEVEMVSGSASTKSRPTTVGSADLGQALQIEEEGKEEVPAEEGKEKILSQITITKPEDSKSTDPPSDCDKVADKLPVINKDAFSAKQQLSLPTSQMGILSPSESVMGMRAPRPSVAQFSDRRSIMSRDSIRERQKLNMEMNTVYAGLNARYADMIQHLMKIDKGFNTNGSSAESSNCESMSGSLAPSNLASFTNQELMNGLMHEISQPQARQGEALVGETRSHGEKEKEGREPQGYQTDVVNEEMKDEDDNEEIDKDGKAENERRSFADTLSHDEDVHSDADSTSYPSYNGNDDDKDLGVSHASKVLFIGSDDDEFNDQTSEISPEKDNVEQEEIKLE